MDVSTRLYSLCSAHFSLLSLFPLYILHLFNFNIRLHHSILTKFNIPSIIRNYSKPLRSRSENLSSIKMKLLNIVKVSASVLFLGQTVAAAVQARDAGTKAKSLAERYNKYIPLIPGIEGVLQYATETLTAQIIGATTSVNQLKHLCQYADSFGSRLAQQGYNVTYMKAAVCAASKQATLASNNDIKAQTQLPASKIFAVQALLSTYAAAELCRLFDEDAGNNEALNGTFVKNEFCTAGG